MLTRRKGRFALRRPGRAGLVLAAAALGLGSVGLVASPASAAGKGPVYVQPWCQNQTINGHWWGYDYVQAYPLSASNPYSWKCMNHTQGMMTGVDMNAACALRYGNPGRAVLPSGGNAYSWYCA